jgi:hypothetical protein
MVPANAKSENTCTLALAMPAKQRDVRYWHKADIATVPNDVRFWG